MQLQLLALVSLGHIALAKPFMGPLAKRFMGLIQIDPVSEKDTESAFEEALREEEPTINEALKPGVSAIQESIGKIVDASGDGGSEDTRSDFEKDVTNLILGLGRNNLTGGSDPSDFEEPIRKIQELIDNELLPAVEEAHGDNQKEMDKLKEELNHCHTTLTTALSSAETEEKTYLDTSPLHKTCRDGEAGLFQENLDNHELWKEKRTEKDLKCKAYSEALDKTGDQKANTEAVEKAGSEAVETYVRRISSTICGTANEAGNGGHNRGGLLDQLLNAKDACLQATKDFHDQTVKSRNSDLAWHEKVKVCNSLQNTMDNGACQYAIAKKDACEAYTECFESRDESYQEAESVVRAEESNRQKEWEGLKRMHCLIEAFKDLQVTDEEITHCREEAHNITHLMIDYHPHGTLEVCEAPGMYPNTEEYKKEEFTPLPILAKGMVDANECAGMFEISVDPKIGSPETCKCTRMTLNGPYSAGAMVKCENCIDVRRSEDKNSCPQGTKLFAPKSRDDWASFLASETTFLRAPNWIVDVTRPANGCAGCEEFPMMSETTQQESWVTGDGSAWWLRSTVYDSAVAEHLDGDYQANCYLDLANDPADADSVTFNDRSCDYHSKSYYCQSFVVGLTPKSGSPVGCTCSKVNLVLPTAGVTYSSGDLIKCEGCIDVSKSDDKNSCPLGTKIFSPRNKEDWAIFIASTTKLADPNWIVDITRPQDGCGGCNEQSMNDGNAAQATWRTSDGSPWFLRSTQYESPNTDQAYKANCYMELESPANENSVTFAADNCNLHSASYYCQTAWTHEETTTTTAPAWDEVGRTVSTDPAEGSPEGCTCTKLELAADSDYSAGALLKCENCLDVYKKGQQNSCPENTKLFAPQSREDWKTFFASGGAPLYAPDWIVDVTRSANGCSPEDPGANPPDLNCTFSEMNSMNAKHHTWTTEDGSPWWLRSSTYEEPTADYEADCYPALAPPVEGEEAAAINEDSITFAVNQCDYHATSYYCQPIMENHAATR